MSGLVSTLVCNIVVLFQSQKYFPMVAWDSRSVRTLQIWADVTELFTSVSQLPMNWAPCKACPEMVILFFSNLFKFGANQRLKMEFKGDCFCFQYSWTVKKKNFLEWTFICMRLTLSQRRIRGSSDGICGLFLVHGGKDFSQNRTGRMWKVWLHKTFHIVKKKNVLATVFKC